MIPVVKAKLLEGKKGLVVGIANEQSIAWGCAAASCPARPTGASGRSGSAPRRQRLSAFAARWGGEHDHAGQAALAMPGGEGAYQSAGDGGVAERLEAADSDDYED